MSGRNKIIVAGLVLALVALAGFGCSENLGEDDLSYEFERANLQENTAAGNDARIIFLHHSTGEVIWEGGVPEWFDEYNTENDTDYQITAQDFPKDFPYGWENYPYDYWNIWVDHAGSSPYKSEPTLEILTSDYDVIMFKHCFPVSDIEQDYGSGEVSSSEKTLANYKLQYDALKEKMHEFPKTDFVIWTGAAQVAGATEPDYARRAQEFFTWVKNDWDESGDNIYIWDFYELETEGGLYLARANAADPYDSHPAPSFAKKVAPLLGQRLVDIIAGQGDNTSLTGK